MSVQFCVTVLMGIACQDSILKVMRGDPNMQRIVKERYSAAQIDRGILRKLIDDCLTILSTKKKITFAVVLSGTMLSCTNISTNTFGKKKEDIVNLC